MPLTSGSRFGPYAIQSSLGAGGMGEVYRATDARLARDVALKVLPEIFARDQERMARFEREAKVLASLNHPNIAALYGLEESSDTRALVMELVEGPMLSERISRGPMLLEEALTLARQIAEALEFAHERGIIHRDLKPANIKLTKDGQVKLLDFGLAKALEGEIEGQEPQNSPTLTAAATRAGVLLGTAAYMAPEQARGKRVDRRADIWAFGCVLYEMLSGKHAFAGETTSDILAGVIRAEPDWSVVPASIPSRISRLLHRCLLKDPKQRLRDIGEARIAIDDVIANPQEPVASLAATAPSVRRRALPWAIATFAMVVVVGLLAVYWRAGSPQSPQVLRASLLLDEPLSGVFTANPGAPFALSRDGSHVVFVGSLPGRSPQLFLRPLDQQATVPIPSSNDAAQPFYSPDSQWVGFFANGKMLKVPVGGGLAITLADAPIPHGGSWMTDDTIIFAPNLGSGLLRIASSGGTPVVLTTPEPKNHERSHRWPQVLPGNNAVLFTIQLDTQASFDDARIAVLSLKTGKWRTIIEGGSYARYVSPGYVVYAHAGALMAVPFDVAHLQVTGSPAPAQEGIITTAGTSGSAEYDVSDSGLLAYVPGNARPPELALAWVDRQGNAKELPAPLNPYTAPRISPDGKRIAVEILSGGQQDLWIYDIARNTLMRLTFTSGVSFPLWMPDNRTLLYRARVPVFSFRTKAADGSGSEQVIVGDDFEDVGATPYSISPDGHTLLLTKHTPNGGIGTYTLALDGSRKVQPFLQSAAVQDVAQFSPDGHWVAYNSSETGRDEIYVQPYPGPGGKWMISNSGGMYARWSRDGHEIFYRNEDKMMSVTVQTQPGFKAGTPRLLFEGGGYVGQGNYDVAPDGQHLLMIKEKEAAASAKQLNIVLHWGEELKRRAPAGKN